MKRPEFIVRSERHPDTSVIEGVVRRAYADVRHSDHAEHRMVARLRENAAFIPELSLIAEVGGEAVGHLLLTPAHIVGQRQDTPTLVLAPLSVVPGAQGQGVGLRLVREAHRRAASLGFRSVLVVGPPAYYRRFGYRPFADGTVQLPFRVPPGQNQGLALAPGGLDGVRGTVAFLPGWLEH